MRADPVSLAIAAFFGAGAFPANPAATSSCAAVTVGILLTTRRVSISWGATLAVVFAFAAARADGAVAAARDRWLTAAAVSAPPPRCAFSGLVVGSPTERRGSTYAVVAIDHLRCERDRSLPVPTVARIRGAPEEAGRGDRVVGVAKLSAPYLFRNEGGGATWARSATTGVVLAGSASVAWVATRGRGPGAVIDAQRARVRARIAATYHPRAESLGRALVLGESDLDPEDDRAFRRSGLSHLLAVSGTHLVVAALAIAAAARALFLRIAAVTTRVDPDRPASALAFILSVAYADFAGGTGSVLRAVCMLGAVLLARAAGRRPAAERAFALSLGLGALIDPLAILDLSFALSAAATAGLLFLAPRLASHLGVGEDSTRPRLVVAVGRAVATTGAATLGCAPVIAGVAREVPVLSLAANLVAAPIGELAALPVCLLHAIAGGVPALERGAARVGSGALLAVLAIARTATSMGAALPLPPPTGVQLAALVAGGAGLAAVRTATLRWLAAVTTVMALAVLELVARVRGAPRGELRVTALDVGQGDALVVDLPDGRVMLVDGGGLPGGGLDVGERAVIPALAMRRRARLDVVVLSHPHADHVGGLPSVLRAVEVGEVWDTGQAGEEGAGTTPALLRELRARGVPILRPDELCGHRTLGGAVVEVLAPCPTVQPGRGANDNSFVMRLTFGRRSVLLTGDAEAPAEAALAARHGAALRADVLKVGHHGSRSSSTDAFIDAVRPTLALTSCGARNTFGHPHAEATARLAGALHGRTDLDGEIRFSTDGEAAWVTFPAW